MLLLVSVVRFVVNFVAKVCNKPFFVKPKVLKHFGNSLNKVSVALILYFIKAQAVEICRKVEIRYSHLFTLSDYLCSKKHLTSIWYGWVQFARPSLVFYVPTPTKSCLLVAYWYTRWGRLIYNDNIAYSSIKPILFPNFVYHFTGLLTSPVFLFYNEIYCVRFNHNVIVHQGRYDFHTSWSPHNVT